MTEHSKSPGPDGSDDADDADSPEYSPLGPEQPPSSASGSPSPVRPLRPSRRTVLAAGVPGAAAVIGLTALTGPRPARLGDPTGDPQLTTALAPHLTGHRHVAVAVLDGSGTPRFGGFGATATSEFEIGSVTKTCTGALLAEAVARGEATVDTTVAEVLGAQADGSAIADVAFAELATHTSGLPRLSPDTMLAGWLATLRRKDPYAGREGDEVIAEALSTTPSGRGERSYSNLGVALQGQLLARLAGTDYATLLTRRLFDPLGLTSTYAPIIPAGLRADDPHGHTQPGLRAAPWTMGGSAPAGGIRSTATDLATYLEAVADGSAPGAAAATEVLFEGEDGERTSMNWFHEDFAGDGTPITWHNGMTGGFASFVGFDPADGRGVIVLSDTARSVDELGVGVLTGEVDL